MVHRLCPQQIQRDAVPEYRIGRLLSVSYTHLFQSIQDFCEDKTVVFLLHSGFSLRPVCGNVQAPNNLYMLFFGRFAVCFLRAVSYTHLENGIVMKTKEGSPQGGNLSPLLANIYLNKFDKEYESRGVKVIRYADDNKHKQKDTIISQNQFAIKQDRCFQTI